MSLPLKIASKYLFARKFTLVNVISMISVLGVAGMSAALIIILSVFNGFDTFLQSMMNRFNPDLQVTASQGKTFNIDSLSITKIGNIPNVRVVVRNIEETVLLQYSHYQQIATIKGVSEGYSEICDIDSCTFITEYNFKDTSLHIPLANVGADIAGNLNLTFNGQSPLKIYAPRRQEKVSMNPADAFSSANIMVGGVFHIHQDFDSKYVIVPIGFARELLEYNDDEVSSLEIAVSDYSKVAETSKAISAVLGDGFEVKDRYQQQDLLYKIMMSEKLSIIVMLSFIIIIASFNIIGALTMLIIDKKKDIQTLSHLGANEQFVKKIFSNTGRLITMVGAVSGTLLGLLVCFLQIHYHFLKFPEGSYIIDYYPVEVSPTDIVITLSIVIAIGFVASVIPTRKITVE